MKTNSKKLFFGIIMLVLGIAVLSLSFFLDCNKKIDIKTLLPDGKEMSLITLTEDTQLILCKFFDIKFTIILIVGLALLGAGISTTIKAITNGL